MRHRFWFWFLIMPSYLYKLGVTDKLSQSVIAATMKRSKSTISRELSRNSSEVPKAYLPDTAEEKARSRRAKSKGRFKGVSATTIEEVKQRLEQYSSPEQILGRMKQEGKPTVSCETIYQRIYVNYQELGMWKQYLRQKQKRRRRKGVKQKRGEIPNRVGIEFRLTIAYQVINFRSIFSRSAYF